MEHPRLLAPPAERELCLLDEQALDCPFAGAALVTDPRQGASISGMRQNLFRHPHCSWVRRHGQLQRSRRGSLELMEQGSEQVSLIRNFSGPGWCPACEK